MSEEEKASLEALVQRISDLLVVIETIAKDLREVVNLLKTSVGGRPAPVPTPSVPKLPSEQTPAPVTATGKRGVADIRMMFPKELENLLTFEENEDYVVIKPRQYLGSENFAKIASIVRGAGGEYISAGKESHFRIPR